MIAMRLGELFILLVRMCYNCPLTPATQKDRSMDCALRIGSVPLYGDLILAPMVGYTDLPFRLLCREMGSAMSYIPCILDEAVIHNPKLAETSLRFDANERPVAIQLLSKDSASLAEAGRRLMAFGPDLLDLNLGCPARHVSWRGRGAALLCDPRRIGSLVASLTRAVSVPVTAKMRLGWDEDTRNYLEVARILEDNGVAAIGVHGRTKAQGFSGRADWKAIAEVKALVKVPVLANGDVRTVADIAAIRSVTGCDAVLIGRGAIGNPWIFQRRDIADVSYPERLAVIRRHLEAMVAYYGEPLGVILFRKHLIKYVQELDGAKALRQKLVTVEEPEALLRLLEDWERPGP